MKEIQMPFQRLASSPSLHSWTGHWLAAPCHGETESGDGLFEEIARVDGQWLFLLVDVTGHGSRAARTVRFLAQYVLPDPACANLAPDLLLAELNDQLQQECAASGNFVAALVARVNGSTGSVDGGNAGQPQPLIQLPCGAWREWTLPGGAWLGVNVPGTSYARAAVSLVAGQALLAFTDGVPEAGAKQGCQFQSGPLAVALAALPGGLLADEVVARLVQSLQAHVTSNWPEDDTTILCLRRT
jgi:serine phosphatase RsbU (regulator of sigma subunit)